MNLQLDLEPDPDAFGRTGTRHDSYYEHILQRNEMRVSDVNHCLL